MGTDYGKRLFQSYARTHSDFQEPDLAGRKLWFQEHFQKNYLPALSRLPPDSRILEIGCGKGFLLAALSRQGFTALDGIDLSPEDLSRAELEVPDATLSRVEGMEHLATKRATYDVILSKAVLEHQPKGEVLPLLEAIAGALRPGGMAILEVPNMDWLFAGHERYMDFTHEIGFTRESLSQVMRLCFPEVTVLGCNQMDSMPLVRRLIGRAAQLLITWLLRLAEPEGAAGLIWERSLLAIGRVPEQDAA